jgi:hypothetical protein
MVLNVDCTGSAFANTALTPLASDLCKIWAEKNASPEDDLPRPGVDALGEYSGGVENNGID